MTIGAFFVSFVIFFWVAVFIGNNQELALENRTILGGVLFAVGIAPAILFQGDKTGRGFRIALSWVFGLIAGLGVALYLFADKWGLGA